MIRLIHFRLASWGPRPVALKFFEIVSGQSLKDFNTMQLLDEKQ